MKRLFPIFIMVMTVCLRADAFTLVKDGLPSCYISVGPDAAPGVLFAARELSDYVRRMTGAELPVRNTAYRSLPQTGKAILIGYGDWMEDERFSDSANDVTMLGREGFVIRSYEDTAPDVLLITGATERGTLFGVYQLLHQLGVRWFTKDITRIPSLKTIDLGDVSTTDLPCFDIRDCVIPSPDISPEWKRHLRLNPLIESAQSDSGTAVSGLPVNCTIADILPDSLYKDIPDIFPLLDGKRTQSPFTRCLTDPDAVTIAADSLLARFDRSPGSHVTAIISFHDSSGLCMCEACRRLRDARKAESAVVIIWAGRVHDRVAKKKPDVRIIVSLGGIFEKPPVDMKVPDGVTVAFCPSDVDQRRPYEESIDERTMAFASNLIGWRTLNAPMLVMHPCGNHAVPTAPFPDMKQVMGSIGLYHYNFVEGCILVYPDIAGIRIPFAELRTWVSAELLWDRYRDGDLLVREWMKGVYGKAWGPMHDYWKHLNAIAETPNMRITNQSDPFEYITDTWLSDADRMLTRAYALSMTDSTALLNVRRERFSLRTMQLLRALQSHSTRKQTYRDMASAWLEESKKLGYERISTDETCAVFAARVRSALK